MPYTKETWDETVPVTPARLNNLELQYEKALADSAPLNYDDSLSAPDLTVGVGKQFASISAAINSLKKVNAGPRTITIDPGTYDETVIINNFIGGKITLQAASGSTANIIVNDIYVNDNSAGVELSNLKISSIGAGFRFQNSGHVLLQNFDVANAASSAAISLVNIARARLIAGTVSNRGSGITAYTSWVYLESVSGNGNGVGIEAANGSIVQKSSSTITGTTPELKSGGSQIW